VCNQAWTGPPPQGDSRWAEDCQKIKNYVILFQLGVIRNSKFYKLALKHANVNLLLIVG